MTPLAEAQARIFALKVPVEAENAPLRNALGRWAATDIKARRTQPAQDLSAMDGYAVRFADGPGPWTMIGESAAGARFAGSVGANDAVRIFTGAVVPDGADTVIMQEDMICDGAQIRLDGDFSHSLGHHVRKAGSDFMHDALIIASGAPLHARHLALAAMAGYADLPVRRRLRVAILSTGDELVAPGELCRDDQIPSSNAPMLSAMLDAMPVDIKLVPPLKDDLSALTACFSGLNDVDIVVTSGGASVGDHDLVVPALHAAGGQIDFWKIAMRPGKPVIAGKLNGAVVLGLPGNPVSAYVTAFLLLLPLVRHLSGAAQLLPQRLIGKSGVDLPANGPRTDHLRAVLHDNKLVPVGQNDSAMLAALSKANSLIIRDINASALRAGDDVDYYMLP